MRNSQIHVKKKEQSVSFVVFRQRNPEYKSYLQLQKQKVLNIQSTIGLIFKFIFSNTANPLGSSPAMLPHPA